MNNHWYNEGKEILNSPPNQGRSDRQLESSYKAVGWSLIGLVVVSLLFLRTATTFQAWSTQPRLPMTLRTKIPRRQWTWVLAHPTGSASRSTEASGGCIVPAAAGTVPPTASGWIRLSKVQPTRCAESALVDRRGRALRIRHPSCPLMAAFLQRRSLRPQTSFEPATVPYAHGRFCGVDVPSWKRELMQPGELHSYGRVCRSRGVSSRVSSKAAVG